MTCDVSVTALVEDTIRYLRGAGYAEGTIEQYRWRWRDFLIYARKREDRESFPALAERYLKSLPAAHGPRWDPSRVFRRSTRVLLEFFTSGRHRIRNVAASPPLPVLFENAIDRALTFAEKTCGLASSTLADRRVWMKRFIRHLIAQRGIEKWEDIVAADLPAYLSSLRVGQRCRGAVYTRIRSMYRILFVQGVLSVPLHELVPLFRWSREAKLSTIWRPEETEAILASVDRSTAIGKRNYAVLLLAMRLGLRACDLRALRLDDIRWDRSCIEIMQYKTHVPLALPLLPDVGEALIDYLRHGPPRGQYREVFLRFLAPHEPYRSQSFYEMMQTYRKKAGLPPKQDRRGLSSLRHTLATRMLEEGVGVETIAGALGHTRVESTRRYLRVDIPLLRQAALDPEKEVGHV